MDSIVLREGIVFFTVLVFSLSVHETAHAWMANRLGDPTAKKLGRISFNPIQHLDLWGTVMIGVMAFAHMGIGWAKPVPVDPRNLKKPGRDTMLISIAGPLSNLILAIVSLVGWGILVLIANKGLVESKYMLEMAGDIIKVGVICNISLLLFNMIPLFPLDGSKVLPFFLPAILRKHYFRYMLQVGIWPLVGLVVVEHMTNGNGPISWVWRPLFQFVVIGWSYVTELMLMI